MQHSSERNEDSEKMRSRAREHLPFYCIKTVSKPYLKWPMGSASSEEKTPQVIGKTEKTRNGMDGLEGNFTHPRQVRSDWSR